MRFARDSDLLRTLQDLYLTLLHLLQILHPAGCRSRICEADEAFSGGREHPAGREPVQRRRIRVA